MAAVLQYWKRFEARLFERHELDLRRPLPVLLVVLRYPYALVRDLVAGDLNLRAMSLVYSTLLSLVPLLAFSFAVLKGLNVHRDFEPLLYEFFRPLGDRATELTDQIMGFVDNVQGGVLGSLGLLFLIWTVITVIQKLEESFNHIWHVDRVRSFGRRFSEYLSIMVVGPVLLVTALGLVGSFASHSAVVWLQTHEPFGTLLVMLGQLVPFVIVSLALAFLYSFVPNTRVRLPVALLAGALAGAGWVIASALFAQMVAFSTRLMAIYASFAILLLALMWIWLNWLLVLAGAQLSFYLQNPQYLRSGQRDVYPTPRLRERLALSVMYLVGAAFLAGDRRWTVDALAAELEVPSAALGPVIDTLQRTGLLETTESEVLVPGRDLGRISLAAVLAAVREGRTAANAAMLRRAHTVAQADDACDLVDAAIQERLGEVTLAEFVAQRAGEGRVAELRRRATG